MTYLTPKDCKPCPKCGAPARVRYRMPFNWVECKKKCGNRSHSYVDGYDQRDPEAQDRAIRDWNNEKFAKLIDFLD